MHTHVCCDMYVDVRGQLWSWFSPERVNVGHQGSGQVLSYLNSLQLLKFLKGSGSGPFSLLNDILLGKHKQFQI